MKEIDSKLDIDELKRKDKLYLKELQVFLDKVDSIKDEELKSQILYQMHRCEERIILMCKEFISNLKV